MRNDVVCLTRLDERYRGVANDGTDATELATRLHRYLAGNDKALASSPFGLLSCVLAC